LAALASTLHLSTDLYDNLLADHETRLAASLNEDADDALLCRLANEGQVAMLVIDWGNTVHRNADALQKLQVMWPHSLDAYAEVLVPILCDQINQRNLGVAGIKWTVWTPK
jgi:hypothetical protein